MKRIYLILFLVLFLAGNVFAYDDEFSKENIKKLFIIERIIFGKVSKNTDYNARLNAAEKKVFGAVQSGNVEDRINFLGTVAETSNQGYERYVNPPVYTTNNPLGIITNLLIQRQGVLTGFTPPLEENYQNNYYRPYYEREYKNVPPMYRNINGNNNFNNRLIRTY